MAIAINSSGARDVFSRLGAPYRKPQKVCRYWLKGCCNRNPCPYLHQELPEKSGSINGISLKKRNSSWVRDHTIVPLETQEKRNPKRQIRSHGPVLSKLQQKSHCGISPPKKQDKNCGSVPPQTENEGHDGVVVSPKKEDESLIVSSLHPDIQLENHGAPSATVPTETQDEVCRDWLAGNCNNGDKCKNAHSWFLGDSFTLLKQLHGHQKVITGITLPSGSDKLYSGSEDQTLREWDCHTGQCTAEVDLGDEIGCVTSEGPWLLVGIPDVVKVWNTQTGSEHSLTGPVGQVYSIVEQNGVLFAGTQDGKILVWRIDATNNCFLPIASLEGHSLGVVTLVMGQGRLYSGSMDNTIRVWDLDTFQCIHTLTGHTSVVTSVLCWDQFLLSASLDKTIKVWAATERGNLEVVHTHFEENGVLALCGVFVAQVKPVLMCSCNDNTVHIYDLPSFSKRGRIFSREAVQTIQIAGGGLQFLFTGDGAGELGVWKWAAEPDSKLGNGLLNQQTNSSSCSMGITSSILC